MEKRAFLKMTTLAITGIAFGRARGASAATKYDPKGTFEVKVSEVPFRRKAEVSWVLAPEHEKPNEAELELAAKDLDVVWYGELVVPLDPLIDEQLQLELPMKPLCTEGCLGLCPQCGADRNATPCACAEPADDRWTPLRSLLP